MNKPMMFGFPLWKGKIKRRVAKKYLNRWRQQWMLGTYAQESFAKLGVGDFVNDCSGLNGKVKEAHPVYRRIGKGRGAILIDVDLTTTNTGCSLCSCGIEPKLSREEFEKRQVTHSKEWALDDSGQPGTAKYWFGKDTESYEKAVAYARKIVGVIEAGGHIADEDGLLLEEYQRS